MTVVTKIIADVAGNPDFGIWRFGADLALASDNVTLKSSRVVSVIPEAVDGKAVLTVDLDPGPVAVEYKGITTVIEVPDSDEPQDLLALLDAGSFMAGGEGFTPSAAYRGSPVDDVTDDGDGGAEFWVLGESVGSVPMPGAAWSNLVGKPVVDVRDFGAVGDGSTDDTAAIQLAMNAAAEGATVLIPKGTFAYSGELVMTTGTVLQGEGRDEKSADGSRLLATHADAVIRFNSACVVRDLYVDGGGVAELGFHADFITAKPAFYNVLVDDFVDAGFVFDGDQNGTLTNCTARDCKVSFWFVNGAANFDLLGCSSENWGVSGVGVGGAAARVVLAEYNTTDSRLGPAFAEAGAREINFWGGIFEYGSGQHSIELKDSYLQGAIGFHSTQFAGNANTLSILTTDADFAGGQVVLESNQWAFTADDGSALLVDAAGGYINYTNMTISGGQGRNVISKTNLTGTAAVRYDELTRTLVNSTFDTDLQASLAGGSWSAYTTGTVVYNSTKNCADLTMPLASAGAYVPFEGFAYYAQANEEMTWRFRIAEATGQVRLSVRLDEAPWVRTLGVYGNGSHEVVVPLVGGEIGPLFTSNDNTPITAELHSMRCEHGASNGTSNLNGSATLNFSTISAGSHADLTITVPGAILGDAVMLGVPAASVVSGIVYSAWVSADDTVTVRAHNQGPASGNPAAGWFKSVIVA